MKRKTKENIRKKSKSLWHRPKTKIMAQPVFCWLWLAFMAWLACFYGMECMVTLAGFSIACDKHPCLLHNLKWHDFSFVYLSLDLYF
jgi:hypothetical protein